jgi:hypothetical protein
MESTSQVLQDHSTEPILFDQISQTPTNPWTDSADYDDNKIQGNNEGVSLRIPDSELLEQSIIAGPADDHSPVDTKPLKVSSDILSQFDPLASVEEEAAREAWNSAESHPPPPRPASPQTPPPPPLKDPVEPPSGPSPSQPSGLPSFPSLASLAKSFSIPALSRSRPVSFDAAKAVPSPTTLSSFATQQDVPQDRDTSTPDGTTIQTITLNNDGTSSPPPGHRDEIPFDFQKFLDQMKSRSADPVSKYLRSCVLLPMLPL